MNHPMRQRFRPIAPSLVSCAIFLAGTVLPLLAAPDDGDARGKAADTGPLRSDQGRAACISRSRRTSTRPCSPLPRPAAPEARRRPLGRRSPGGGRASGISSASSSPGRRGAVTAEGKTFKGVGIRYAGNASYMASAGGLKRSFFVDLDRADHAAFHGLHAMQLQSGALDPTKAREALAFALFREAGVPAPRTALAEVTLTVPGEHEKAYLGLYTLVEPVDRAFLKDRFGTDKGLLVKPQGLRGLDFLGDDWERYRGPYRPLAEPTPDEAKRLIEFVRLVQRGTTSDSARRSPRTSTWTSSCVSWPSRR